MHVKAETYDIAVYFESNGHGTLVYKMDHIKQWAAEIGVLDDSSFQSLVSLCYFVNDKVGDGIVNIITALACLEKLKMSVTDLIRLYDEKFVKQTSVALPRATLNHLKCSPDSEERLSEPKALQDQITGIFKKYSGARGFIRPSGTEDICRIYIESDNSDDLQPINEQIKKVLDQFARSVETA